MSKVTIESLLEHAPSKYALAVEDAQEKGEKFQSDKEPVTDYPTSKFVSEAIRDVARGEVPYQFPEA